MVLRKQLHKDPQFRVALELVQDKDMYRRIITPEDAKASKHVELYIYMALLCCYYFCASWYDRVCDARLDRCR